MTERTSPRVDPKLRVLFLCTGNSCRSQMAEGWARHLLGDRIEAHSAGVAPKGLDPRAVRVMAEAGVDLSGQTSKHVDDVLAGLAAAGEELDRVVTVCDSARESCPVFPGRARVVHRSFDDPPRLAAGAATEEEALAPYRRVRDEIRAFVAGLPEALGPLVVPSGAKRSRGTWAGEDGAAPQESPSQAPRLRSGRQDEGL